MKTDETKQPGTATLAARSARRYLGLVRDGWLHLRKGRIGQSFAIEDGRTYRIFRETVRVAANQDPAVLVVGFKLRLIGASAPAHWLFQRVCALTTPFWSGFKGFRIKLWMVAPASGHYLGIYEWQGEENAEYYVRALVRVLRPLSVDGSVWHALHAGSRLDAFLNTHDVQLLLQQRKGSHAHAVV